MSERGRGNGGSGVYGDDAAAPAAAAVAAAVAVSAAIPAVPAVPAAAAAATVHAVVTAAVVRAVARAVVHAVVRAVVGAVIRVVVGAVVGAALWLALPLLLFPPPLLQLLLLPCVRPPSLSLAPSFMHVRPLLTLSSICGLHHNTCNTKLAFNGVYKHSPFAWK